MRLTTGRLVLIFVTFAYVRTAAAATVASSGDAAIAHDQASATWMLSAGGATLTLLADATHDLEIAALRNGAGPSWSPKAAADTFVRVNGNKLPLGRRASGFVFRNSNVESDGDRLQLNVRFNLIPGGMVVTRHYRIVSGSPTFEAWTTFTPGTTAVTLSDINAFVLAVPAGTIRWVNGLQDDAANALHQSTFSLQARMLSAGDSLWLGAQGRSSELTVPWLAVDGAQDEFYAALMWSGAWSLNVSNVGSTQTLELGLGSMSTDLVAEIDGPHALFGVAPGGLGGTSAALRSYVTAGIRRGRPLSPQVTYNTWFAYGTELDDASLRGEMREAAALGVELFVVDAGWYAGAGADGPFDFESGLGSWRADPARFPDGLKPLTDYAHSLGMNFGLWVEPERTSLALLGEDGIDESLLATHDGDYGSDHAAQICFGAAAARQWVLSWLTQLLDDVQPDYLKWDNNMFVSCNRTGHGHGTADGNFAHVSGLYAVLAVLRDRYPDMQIENVSGGGNRLDLGMLRYTDVAWMDDRTSPSVHVRHNIEGLGVVFPPAYLLSFVTDQSSEPLRHAPDLAMYMRSRMAGVLGLCFRSAALGESDLGDIAQQIEIYKSIRGMLAGAAAALLTDQAQPDNGPAWDVLQESSVDAQQVVIAAFQSDASVPAINIKPAALDPHMYYEVQSVDAGVLGSATGAALMADGVDVVQSASSAAHILTLTSKVP